MTTVETIIPRSRRNVELLMLVFAIGITLLAWVNVDLGVRETVPTQLLAVGGGFLALAVAFHVVLRLRAPYADPVMLPVAVLLNGLGLVMIHRLDLASGQTGLNSDAARQLLWTALAVVIAAVVLVVVRDHRQLRRRTFTMMAIGLGLLLLPMLPVIGTTIYGSRIWIRVGPFSFQPGEIAKLALTIFFAGYLVQVRDVLSIAGKKVLGFTFPRGRDLGPILIAWIVSLGILIFQRDLGSSLLFFGLFVAMLYVATERVSWVIIGLALFAGGAYLASQMFGHVAQRVQLWLDPFSQASLDQSDQLAKGLMGMAAGGLFGTGLGQGRPWLVAFANSDFIFASFGEEIGLFGVFGLLALYAIFVERGLRTSLGVRDQFGKLLAFGLAFSVGLQVFVVIGGVTRVIPLTGLTTPFMSLGGSSLLANWTVMALLLRISDQARRPLPDDDADALPDRVAVPAGPAGLATQVQAPVRASVPAAPASGTAAETEVVDLP